MTAIMTRRGLFNAGRQQTLNDRHFCRVFGASGAALALCCSLSHAGENDQGRVHRTRTPIEHLVVIFQENRTFDNYFGTYPFAANIPGELNTTGSPAPQFHARPDTPKANNYITDPNVFFHNPNVSLTGAQANPTRWLPSDPGCAPRSNADHDTQEAVDGGLMDQFVQFVSSPVAPCPADDTGSMKYFDGNTVTALWNYAQHYAMSDAFFQTTYAPSTPGHINLISGNTHGAILHGTNNGAIYTNPVDGTNTLVSNINPFLDDCSDTTAISAEMTGRNVGDLLNAKNITWGWFTTDFAPTTPAVLNPDGSTQVPATCPNDGFGEVEPFMFYASTRNPHHLRPNSVAAIGATDQANHQYDYQDFVAALQAGNFPAVTFLKNGASEHAPQLPTFGQAYYVQIINEIMKTPEWENTAIIITYDDAGGWYDHAAPPVLDPSDTPDDFHCGNGQPVPGAGASRCRLGMRMPFVVISPWAKENHIDHTVTELASVTRFIEDNWDLGSIDGPTRLPPGWESFDRVAGSIMGLFDFQGQPRVRPLILDPSVGTVVNEAGPTTGAGQSGNQNRNGG